MQDRVEPVDGPVVGYRAVLRDREYGALFAADLLSVVGDQVTRLAVALLVLSRTGSALAASATYAVSYLTYVLGGPVLTLAADRFPRRTVLLACDLARAALVCALAVRGLPLPVLFALLTLAGLLAPPFDAARSALLADVLEGDRYAAGNALSTAAGNAGQAAGFLLGGLLVAAVGTSSALLVDAGTFVVSAALVAARVRRRAAPEPAEPGAGLLGELSAGAALVAGSPALRGLLGWAALSAAVAIPAEGLAVVVASDAGSGAVGAGLLTAAVPAGYLLGVTAVLRLPPHRRTALFPVLVLVSAGALLLTPVVPGTALRMALWVVAGTGTALQVVANAAFVQAVPPALRGRAFGVAGAALAAVQGGVLLASGAVADPLGPARAVAACAAAGIFVLVCAALYRVRRRDAQGRADHGRGWRG